MKEITKTILLSIPSDGRKTEIKKTAIHTHEISTQELANIMVFERKNFAISLLFAGVGSGFVCCLIQLTNNAAIILPKNEIRNTLIL